MRVLFDDSSNIPSRWENPYSIVTARVAPPVLHVSREARREALKHYKIALGRSVKTTINGATLEVSYPAKTYVNWKADIICPTDCFDVRAFPGDEGLTIPVLGDLKLLDSLTRVAVSLFDLDMTLKRLLPRLAVKDVIVYLHHGLEDWSEEQREDMDDMDQCPCPTCSSINTNSKYEISFIDTEKHLENLSKTDYDEDLDNVAFTPEEGRDAIKSTRKRVNLIRHELVKNNTKPEWKVPRFEVMAMEIREKERYYEHEQERLKRLRKAKQRST